MKKKINHNNLLPWFTDDHGTLPASYLASCEKFFKSLKHTNLKEKYASLEPEAPSSKHQASSATKKT